MSFKSFSVVIPTYNRADILEENLLSMLPALLKQNVGVFVLDDSTNDDTEKLVSRLSAQNDLNIKYVRNKPSLGHDSNVLSALMAPDTDFVWLLGDSMYFDDEALSTILGAAKQQDLIFLNARQKADGELVDINDRESLRSLMVNRTWELTMTGATIYGRRVLDWWRNSSEKTKFRNFPQLSIVLGFILSHDEINASWIGRKVVYANLRKKSYWLDNAVEVFGRDWFQVVSFGRGFFGEDSLKKVLNSHARMTGVLTFKHFFSLRARKKFSVKVLRENRQILAACSPVDSGLLWLPALCPVPVAVVAVKILRVAQSLKNTRN